MVFLLRGRTGRRGRRMAGLPGRGVDIGGGRLGVHRNCFQFTAFASAWLTVSIKSGKSSGFSRTALTPAFLAAACWLGLAVMIITEDGCARLLAASWTIVSQPLIPRILISS